MNIAIIPARSGSKRIPGKNMKVFCGKPMIAYAISAALDSRLFDHIAVSTDDEEIARIANEWGAETPFIRPVHLADDHTETVPVIAHAVEAYRALGWQFDKVCCIYPSVPFIQIDDLMGALGKLSESKLGYCFPVAEYSSTIQRALRRMRNDELQPFYAEFERVRTQDLESAYFDAGQFYWGSADAWISQLNIHSNGIGYVIPSWRAIDIDTPDDWIRAELIYRSIINKAVTI